MTRNTGDIAATVSGLGLTVESVFVPFSQSRNKGEKQPSLNWRVTLQRNGRDIITTDYGAGSAHCPAYKQSVRRLGAQNSIMRQDAIRFECEEGYAANVFDNANSPNGYTVRRIDAKGARLEPNALDVIHSLLMDGGAIDEGSFEDWASNLGYETDSRKAEAMYRACVDIGLKLRNALGEAGLSELREAFSEY
jgi:hypothetical protein